VPAIRGLVVALAVLGVACAGDSPRTLEAWPGTVPVLDGSIAPGEWDDAAFIDGPQGWISQFAPVRDPKDLSFRVWIKHAEGRLFVAWRVRDDILYGIDTPRWLPKENELAHELSRRGYPWFGDGVELLIHAGPKWTGDEQAAGNGFSWQMVASLTKSRLGGIGKGGLLEGEPRSKLEAWNTYQRWINERAMEAAAAPLPGGGGYVIEWAVRFRPGLELDPGVFYDTALGDRPFGLNIAVADIDTPEAGAGSFGNFHHEEWFAGARNVRTQLRHWGTLWIRTSPRKTNSR